MLVMDFFMPTMDIAEIFRRNAGTEADILKTEVIEWFKKLIKSPLENYINKVPREAKSPEVDADTEIKLP
jgi:hypothetical protein